MKKRTFYHIIFWFGYVALKTMLNIDTESGNGSSQFSFPVLKMLIAAQLAFLLVKIPMVYTLFHITGKYISKKWGLLKTISLLLLLLLISMAVYFPIKQFIVLNGIYKEPATISAILNFTSIFSAFFILFFTCSIAMAVKLIRSNIRQKEKEAEIVKQKLEAELAFLRSQTNPHFLFNTLNNIYALARKKSDDTAAVVMKLSNLLRFMLYESQKKQILVAEEVQIINDYIELEKIRYTTSLKLSFIKSIDNENQPIAPLILLPFVENAFKHGASENRFGSEINIELYLKEGSLLFKIENTKPGEIQLNQSEKLGLRNIKRQLELLYPDHVLIIDNGLSHFKVSLKINLLKDAAV